ncbi:class I SAM-dependent methyltransferase [Paucisalibacillus sp. EB02]|uniref:class I SAM-dependent methyltransferase n=1 Tax=Paucisalibacillus sp. EB02 TaxID=1347087 RepID=UPI0004B79DD6|nr:class I SAM-dependent methyltransferase [Paucisalibacillus sp. EB02]
MKGHVTEIFNQLSTVYEKTVDKEGLYNTEYERPAMLNELPKDLSNKKILDAGCAAGWYTEQLIQRGATVVAIDISPEMVNATKRRVVGNVNVICMDLEAHMPFTDNTFDYIISSLTLHYLKDWKHTFQEIKRVLKPNGTLLFSVHHPFTDISWTKEKQYYSTELIIDNWNKDGKTYEVPFYRRPLQYIINTTSRYFLLEKIIEPQPTQTFKEYAPEKYEVLLKRPQFLIIKSTNSA